jgi:hypothetical protein
MRRTDHGRRPHQVPGLVLVALGAARAVHDRADPVHRGVDALTGGQIAGHELDAVRGVVAAPTQHPHVTAGIPQQRHDEASQRARATGEQDG